ncbi:hypothetical protein ARMGADRAFT_884532, partial [Armillaria gallica]
ILRCWMVWGRRRLPVLLPIFVLIAAIGKITQIYQLGNSPVSSDSAVFKITGTYNMNAGPTNYYPLSFTLYSSFVLVTTWWCTVLIIYRIVTVARAGKEIGGGLRAYRHIIEILVESSALYSVFLVLYVIIHTRGTPGMISYFDVLAGIARGIAPTLLVGRVAAGHSRPDDSW